MRLTSSVAGCCACLAVACAQGTAMTTVSEAAEESDARTPDRVIIGDASQPGNPAISSGRDGGSDAPLDGALPADASARDPLGVQDASVVGGGELDAMPELPPPPDAATPPATDPPPTNPPSTNTPPTNPPPTNPPPTSPPPTNPPPTNPPPTNPPPTNPPPTDPPLTPDAGGPPALPDAAMPLPMFSYVPSNVVLTSLDFASAPSAALACGNTEINTAGAVTLTNWCGAAPRPVVQGQAGAPELVVIPLRELSVAMGNTLRVVGPRPVAFVVLGPVSIAGELDVSASGAMAGPGGNNMCGESKGGDGRGTTAVIGSGGGGGGYGTPGGPGGAATNVSEVGDSGEPRGTASLVPLIGGCGGGPGGGCTTSQPGAGGGAIQISASAGLVVRGAIRASGGQGAAGCAEDAGGSGGGSGGAILLEGTTLDVVGAMLRANGGAGGEGQAGGAGGAGANDAQSGGAPGARGPLSGGGGGGGGGYGRVQLRAAATCSGC